MSATAIDPACGCRTCVYDNQGLHPGMTMGDLLKIRCGICDKRRCLHAKDHHLPCHQVPPREEMH